MSVSRNQLRLAPYYDFKLYNVSLTGLESNRTRAAAASPTVSLVFGQVVLTASTSIANGLWKSTNNINWSQITTAPNTAIYSVAYGNNTFVAVGDAGVIYTSPGTDGETWTAQTKAGASANPFNKVTFVNGLFFAQQQSANMQYSSDGITWALVSGVSANIPNFPDADILGQFKPFLIYSKGTYIWFNGETSNTASARVFWINESSITTGSVNWSNNSISSTGGYQYGRPDPGDGLGPFFQLNSGTTYEPTAKFTRINTGNVSANFQTTSFATSLNEPYWGGGIDASSNSVGPAGAAHPNGHPRRSAQPWNGLYYNEGWYTSVLPSEVAQNRFGAAGVSDVYAIGVSRWSENEFYPSTTLEGTQDKQVSILPNYVVDSVSEIEERFQNVSEWDQGGKKIILLSTTRTTVNRSGGSIVLVGSRAIRPLRTTINEKVG